MTINDERLMRRVAGYHDLRLDGIGDLLSRARDASVLDIGCNRGLVSFEFANNGATVCHGCDYYEEGIKVARGLFADLRAVRSRFEVLDLTGGAPEFQKMFGQEPLYDIVLLLATLHKLKRQMDEDKLKDLVSAFAKQTGRFFAWRGEDAEKAWLDGILRPIGLRRVQTSTLSRALQTAAIWERGR